MNVNRYPARNEGLFARLGRWLRGTRSEPENMIVPAKGRRIAAAQALLPRLRQEQDDEAALRLLVDALDEAERWGAIAAMLSLEQRVQRMQGGSERHSVATTPWTSSRVGCSRCRTGVPTMGFNDRLQPGGFSACAKYWTADWQLSDCQGTSIRWLGLGLSLGVAEP